MESYPQKLKELLAEFKSQPDWDTRAQMLIDYGEQFKPVPESIAQRPYPAAAKVPACESEAYFFSEPLADGSRRFYFAVENPQGLSAKAMAAIIDETLSGAPPTQVATVSEEIVYDFFGRSISMGKGLGLMGMVQMVRAAARSKSS